MAHTEPRAAGRTMNQQNLPEIGTTEQRALDRPERAPDRAVDQKTLAATRDAGPLIHNGEYTISHPKRGRFTVKVGTAQKGALVGKRIIYLLTGPDNTRDYRGVAFWSEEEKVARVWQRYRGPNSIQPLDGYHYQLTPVRGWSAVEQKVAIFLDLALRELAKDRVEPAASHFAAEGYQILCSSRCVRCNRLLTTPESITMGIGPECASKTGGG